MASNNTLTALLRRGLDSTTATSLVTEGYSLQDLQLMSIEKMMRHGVSQYQAESILDKSRPPIPNNIFMKVVHDSKWRCCICREKGKGVIVA